MTASGHAEDTSWDQLNLFWQWRKSMHKNLIISKQKLIRKRLASIGYVVIEKKHFLEYSKLT